jgi:hypothetical protein
MCEVRHFITRLLHQIDEIRLNVKRVLGRLNLTEPLSRRGLPTPCRRGIHRDAVAIIAPEVAEAPDH